jgi:hypothetical protein
MSAPLRRAERAFSLSTKRGWAQYVYCDARTAPERMTRSGLERLSDAARLEYDEQRAVWHANLGPIKTPQWLEVHADLWNILRANRQEGDKVKPPPAIDAFPGLGKTMLANNFCRDYHRRQIELYGALTEAGHERIPVVRIQLTDTTTRRDFNSMLCRFFNLPGHDTGSANRLGNKAANAIESCEATLILVDDAHFLDMNRRDARAVANHFKFLSSLLGVTFLYVGVGLGQRGLLDEGLCLEQEELAQNARRITALSIDPFTIRTETGRRTWRRLLLAIEKDLALAGAYPGMVADDLSDLLWARSTGHFASLMTVIARACDRAITTGAEALTAEIVTQVKNDAASERHRVELLAALEAGQLTSRPGRRPARGGGVLAAKSGGGAR